MTEHPHLLHDLDQSLSAVGDLVAAVGPDQWTAPTPCADWDVRRLVEHLTGMNLVFAALLRDEPPPRRGEGLLGDAVRAFRESAGSLVDAFSAPGVLERSYEGPLGSATGEERLKIRMYDLLGHGWDLGQATGRAFGVPDRVADEALAFARVQLASQSRAGRFAEPQQVPDAAPALERLVAFLGRAVPAARGGHR